MTFLGAHERDVTLRQSERSHRSLTRLERECPVQKVFLGPVDGVRGSGGVGAVVPVLCLLGSA